MRKNQTQQKKNGASSAIANFPLNNIWNLTKKEIFFSFAERERVDYYLMFIWKKYKCRKGFFFIYKFWDLEKKGLFIL